MARVRVDTERLVEMRRQNGWSQAQLGNLWDVTRGTLSNYERGNHHPISWQLRALSRILERPLDKLLADIGATEYRVEAWAKQGWQSLPNLAEIHGPS
jgi:transcriptional regulator with XRE-family HTH domain